MAFKYMSSDSGQRERWDFHYTGTEVSTYARRKAALLLEEERGLEQALREALDGVAYSGKSEDLSRLRGRLHQKGEERERCEVFARELARAGDRIFSLDVDDLVYFKMEEGISDPTIVPE
jgi:hypothetical protein